MQDEKISPLIFSRTVRALMKDRELRQEDLAAKTGVSQGAVSGWLNESIPKGDVLYRLARALGVSMEHLLTGENSSVVGLVMEPPPPQLPLEVQRLASELAEKARALDAALKKF